MSDMGSPELRPFQREIATSFFELAAQRALVVMPTGAGKSVLAAAVISETNPPGPFLVIAPSPTTMQWVDRLSRWGIRSSPLNSRTLGDFHDYRNRIVHGQGSPQAIAWVCSFAYAGRKSVAAKIREMPWRLVVIDEAHRADLGGESAVAELVRRSPAVLGLTATPTWDPARFDMVRLDGGGQEAVLRAPDPVVVKVAPTAAELSFVERFFQLAEQAVAEELPTSVRPSPIEGREGILPAIYELEKVDRLFGQLLGPSAEPDQRGAGQEWLDRVRLLLAEGYSLELPDTRTRAIVDSCAQAPRSTVLIGRTIALLSTLQRGLEDAGIPYLQVTASFAEDERRNAALQGTERGLLLVVAEASASESLLEGRERMVHADLPNEAAIQRRAELLRVPSRARPSIIVRWDRVDAALGRTR
jgi:hypothetical protein